ncbi:MAG TPA: PilZ domain-containing protein, partial [Spirochaetia bacterium]|nr:PilZ domain-containing protein [Spirochaetia bacterium]
MTRQTVFNMCATRLMKQEDGLEPRVSALRVKLGFTMTSSEKQVNTTTILPLNIHLLVVQRETKKFYTRIVGSDATGMVLRIVDESIIAPGIGTDLVCYFKMKSGTFHFQSKVTVLDGQRIKISHSENVERSQQRKYYRIKTHLPCFVRLAGSEEKPAPTRFDDLSGGGASIKNPDPKYRKGDDVEIQFQTSEDTRYRIVSEIVRVSDEGDVLHLEFGPMNESGRDRLISFILNQRKKQDDSKSGP